MSVLNTLRSLWFGFKIITVAVAYILSIVFVILSVALFRHGGYFLGMVSALFCVSCASFSYILRGDIEREERSRQNKENTTTVFRFER